MQNILKIQIKPAIWLKSNKLECYTQHFSSSRFRETKWWKYGFELNTGKQTASKENNLI